MPIAPKTWAAVRNAYFEGELTILDLCAKFEIDPKAFSKRRLAEGWPARPRLTPRSPNGQFQPTARPTALSASAARTVRGELISRLYRAIDLKLIQMEKLMATEPKATTSADHEREARVVAGMARTFEHVTELNADLIEQSRRPRSGTAGKSSEPAPTDPALTGASANPALATSAFAADPASAERLRRDIAQRLERILEKRNPPGDAG
jgi:hypothetical protein